MSHARQRSGSVNRRAQLASAYQELGKELASEKLRVVGNYTLGKVIGEGTYGKVRLGTHRITSTRVAIKQIPKDLSAQLTREIHHHRQLHHPNVTQLYEVIATESYIWLVTELCTGGELFDYLVEKGRLAEREARLVFGQLCLAIGYVHKQGVVHRDLKLENVLLDERCHVKLGDFGFTREFESGRLLETFCGTTGYASPEMLLGQKYSGQEVDIWSLGVILYSLLCGGLPFDDDDESVMRTKVIHGVYAEPEWLSEDARDLIRSILQRDPEKRLPLAKILSHPWFTKPLNDAEPSPPSDVKPQGVKSATLTLSESERRRGPLTPVGRTATVTSHATPSASSPSQTSDASQSSSFSERSYHSATTDFDSSPTTPDVTDGGDDDRRVTAIPSSHAGPLHRTGSQATIKNRPPTLDLDSTPKAVTSAKKAGVENLPVWPPVLEEEPAPPGVGSLSAFPARTPVRTKRRSVSSAFSPPPSPTSVPGAVQGPDFVSMLDFPHPVVFTTPLERELLNSLSELGFDTGQMVHSVLTNACDPSGAIWWMLRRKAERRAELQRVEEINASDQGENREVDLADKNETAIVNVDTRVSVPLVVGTTIPTPVALQTLLRPSLAALSSSVSAPELSIRPATPQTPIGTNRTPPRSHSPARNALSPGSPLESPDKRGKRNETGRGRTGSISMLQRASTALGAAGLGRKKSAEVLLLPDQNKDGTKETEKEKSRDSEEGKTAQNSKTSTPSGLAGESRAPPESPWIFPPHTPELAQSATPAASPAGDTLSPLPDGGRRGFMSTLKMWWQDDRRKRKHAAPPPIHPTHSSHRAGTKRKSAGKGRALGTSTPRRPTAISRRSSSVNSRRSSAASLQKDFSFGPEFPAITRQRSDPSRRSFTPTSERGEIMTSRPPSVRSLSYNGPNTPRLQRPQHGRQSSNSSIGSAHRSRTAPSPLQQYHRRGGSGSSVKVIRQIKAVHPPSMGHYRSDSTASSLHSIRSPSRPSSFYAASPLPVEEHGQLLGMEEALSPTSMSPPGIPLSTVGIDERKATYSSTMLVAHKSRPAHGPPSASPYASASRSSWRKSWGLEPPGWATRTIQAPSGRSMSEDGHHAHSPGALRDVFAGKYGGTSSEDDEWVDEDDDPRFVGGLGQSIALSSSPPQSAVDSFPDSPLPLKRQLHPEAYPTGRKAQIPKGRAAYNTLTTRSTGHDTMQSDAPPPKGDSHGGGMAARGRRQLPASRGGPAFRSTVIQEEDEGEE